ncbi:MAG: bifunctional phosphopantothenoylcysteine decarboxylase/phosphopantothenate--cysteine ligase CoaBC [Bacteroidota bacterium]
MQLKGKKILLGITGSIAAYKSASLVRLLIKEGAEVQVLMTEAATEFISPLTLSTLSKNSVHSDIATDASWNNHVELGLWADVLVIAPLTATTLAKMANGFCDNILTASYLSAKCPVMVAPAMDLDMWKHPATRKNIITIKQYGNQVIPVGHGELASGLKGEGRMAEPEEIVDYITAFLSEEKELTGKRAIVTAGPTYEPIDPVRFIGNRSSGKMGIAIAEALAEEGALVTLVLGPTHLTCDATGVNTIEVETAQDMYEAATEAFTTAQIAVLAAAVADYRPETVANQKIKKKSDGLTIPLGRTKDIAAELGRRKVAGQLTIGFALETNNELENAKGKLAKKNFDFIVLNSLQDKGAGFRHDTNKVKIISADEVKDFPLKTKKEVAEDIVQEIVNQLK